MVNAIRKIVEAHERQIVITLPQQFQHLKMEVIILPLCDDADLTTAFDEQSQQVNYAKYFGVSRIGKTQIDQELQTLRSEWERVCT